ncbi:ABC transporter substrate-binding protein [Halobellus rarus]|uniref:ABC transporter substrate-binding protein n=1 Tax=Halobellus rarus TaxID=1126237 RepID=A0ABD6CSK8_9EURY
MSDSDVVEIPTRRDIVKSGGAVVGGSLLAGCSGDDTSPSSNNTTASTTTSTESATADQSYSVTMEPVGEVEFDEVPESWLAMTAGYADMGIALGQQPPEGITSTGRYHTHHYDDIPDISVNKEDILQLFDAGIDKELFYSLDVDLHVFDPNFLINRVENLDETDIAEIESNISPLIGNTIFSRQYSWHDGYPYYTMYEAFEKMAEVFQEQERYQAFVDLHDEVIGEVTERIPPESERPSVATLMVVSEEPGEFYPFRIEQGTGWKQWRDLGVKDGLAGTGTESFTASRATMGYEALLEADPDYLMLYGYESMSASEFRDTFLTYLQNHEVGSRLTAVENGNVYRAGGFYQGPIINLSLTERAAKQLYPEEFDAGEQLYDRQRVANIINGDL